MPNLITDENNPFFEAAPEAPVNWGRRFLKVSEVFAALLFLGIVLYLFVFSPHQVKGPSMEATLFTDQILLVNKLYQFLDNTTIGKQVGFSIQRGDIVVFHISGFEDAIVKRVIALPGDRIALRNGQLFVNGKQAVEPYLQSGVTTNSGDFLRNGDEKLVPDGSFFLAGDNRPHSIDSRFSEIGFVKRENITGKVVIRVWPLNNFSLIGTGNISFI